jgi:fucose 4-O-acetylase-like acetyltransferase
MRSSAILFTTTIASVLLIFAATAALGEPPGAASSGQEVADWFATQGGNARMYAWLMALFVPFFAAFVALVRARLPAPHRDVFLIGAVALVAETAISTWLWAGLSWHAEQLQPATARTLLDVASFWGPVLNGATISMLAPVVVLSWGERAVLPRWLGVVGAVALAEQTIETVTIFGQDGFTAPGGPMNVYLGAALVSIWLLCLGIRLARSADTGAPNRHPADSRA